MVEEDLYQLKACCEGHSIKLGRPVMIQGTDFPDVWCALEFLSNQEHSTSQISSQELQNFVDQLRIIQGVCDQFGPLVETLKQLEMICATHESRLALIRPMLLSVKQMDTELKDTVCRLDEIQKLKLFGHATSVNMDSDLWTQSCPSSNSEPLSE